MNDIEIFNAEFEPATKKERAVQIGYIASRYRHAEIILKDYDKSLEPYPLWALQKAVLDLVQGRVDGVDASFCPPAPKVAQVANELVIKRRKDLGDQMRRATIEAESRQLASRNKKVDPAMKARVAAKLAEFHKARAEDGFGISDNEKQDWKPTAKTDGKKLMAGLDALASMRRPAGI